MESLLKKYIKEEGISDFSDLTEEKWNSLIKKIDSAFKNVSEDMITYESYIKNLEIEKRSNIKEVSEAKDIAIQSAKMASMGEMAGGIAHEINNPLQGIMISTAMLELYSEEDKLTKDIVKDEIEKIRNTIDLISNIIKSVKKLYKKENYTESLKPINLENQIEEAMVFCVEKLKNHNIKMIKEIQPGLVVQGRESEFNQILVNLLNNSYEALKNERSSNQWVKLTVKKTNRGIEVSVQDSGAGVPEEKRYKIFENYFTTKKEGTGMGLSMSKKIMKSYSGDLILEGNNNFIAIFKNEVL